MSNHPNHDDRALLKLVKQHAGDDFVRELLSWALHRFMEAEVGEIISAAKGERAPEERENIRNGYRSRRPSSNRPTSVGPFRKSAPG